MSSSQAGARIVFRCDGNEQIGAGHVARCLPLADAFEQLCWTVGFVGSYEGFAAWLLARAEVDVRPPDLEAPCGIPAGECDAAVIDSYLIAPAAICELARTLPVVTLAEANRCPTRGVLLDYHLDMAETASAHLLAGPSFAPLDPLCAGAGRAGAEIRRVLVTLGMSLPARAMPAQIAPLVNSVFPDAEIVLTGSARSQTGDDSAQSETNDANLSRVIELPSPTALVSVLPEIDLAVTAAGFTSYELACAGIPQVAIALAANQRRVVRGLQNRRLAPCLDLTSGDSLTELPTALEPLRDVGLRRLLAERGRTVFDGQGARRAAIALTKLIATAG